MKLSLIIFSCFFFHNTWAKQKNKILPRSLQKAYIVQKMAIVYARPDFDSLQIAEIPYGKKVTISKRIFSAQRGFGTFYQIFLSKPRKIKAYISEVDVVGSQQKSSEGKWVKNPKFKTEQNRIHTIENPRSSGNSFKNDPPLSLSRTKLFGISTTHFWKGYKRLSLRKSTWFFNLQLNGKGLPIKNIDTDITVGFAITRPAISGIEATKGYILKSDFLVRFPMIDSASFLLFSGLGFMVKIKGVLTGKRADGNPLNSAIGGGIATLLGAHIPLNKRFMLLVESRFYYDILERKIQPGLGGGFLVNF